jgi:uncharacterized protein YgiM (DUF1202 family)
MILCLAFLSLACLQTAEPMVTYPADTPGPALSTVSPVATENVKEFLATSANEGAICALVIAEEALHLRKGPSEKDIVLTWLDRGDLVRVIDQSDGDWWFIEHAGVSGYARATYLTIGDCETENEH